MLWLVVVVPVVVNVAVLVSRVRGARQNKAPVRPPASEWLRLAQLVGEPRLVAVESWLRAARVHRRVGWATWLALEAAERAERAGREDVLRETLAELDDLSQRERAALLQAASGGAFSHQALRGQLQLLDVRALAGGKFELAGFYDDNVFATDDGEQARAVIASHGDRVMFTDPEHARRAAPQLHAAGARALYRDRSTGAFVEV